MAISKERKNEIIKEYALHEECWSQVQILCINIPEINHLLVTSVFIKRPLKPWINEAVTVVACWHARNKIFNVTVN